ncbi:DUF6639 family protein [Roseovarius aestuariivivens]|uniref:DUF6639 family protein n=1 Tax=Roseovarius aestuariivivens TaxID=1888910 RepID=UPI0010819FE0|nr:DUF6639 family protein [Roseovarius aestuariivivens]
MIHTLFRFAIFNLTLCLVLSQGGRASEPVLCPQTSVTVEAANPEDAARSCRAAQTAIAQMTQCEMPLDRPITLTLREELAKDCLGLYHCGEDRIDLLSPRALEEARSETSAFAHLPTPRFFDTLVAHELAHAAFDARPCPLESCVVAAEYLAYTAQVRVLTEAERAPFKAMTETRTISRDEINVMLLFMAPQSFARKAWAHLNQRPDPCAFVGQVMSGHVLMDRVHP